MIHTIWLLNSIALVSAIMIHNPKSQGMGGQNQFFTSTRSSEASLNQITWLLIISFFFLTTCLAITNKYI